MPPVGAGAPPPASLTLPLASATVKWQHFHNIWQSAIYCHQSIRFNFPVPVNKHISVVIVIN